MFDVSITDYQSETNKLEALAEVDEQDDSDDDYHDCMDMPEVHYVNEAQVSTVSRCSPWLLFRPRILIDGR